MTPAAPSRWLIPLGGGCLAARRRSTIPAADARLSIAAPPETGDFRIQRRPRSWRQLRMFERLRGTVGYGGDLGVATSCLAHQDSGQPVAGPVDYFRAQAHLVVRLPAEAERVREPVDAVENEADMQSVDNGLIRHTGGTHRVDAGSSELHGALADLLQQWQDGQLFRPCRFWVAHVDLPTGLDAGHLGMHPHAERALVEP